MESPDTWDLLTATLSWVNPNATSDATQLVRFLGLMRSAGLDALVAAIQRERPATPIGPSFAKRVSSTPALQPFLTPRAHVRDPFARIACGETKRFRLGLRRRACSICGHPSAELWDSGVCRCGFDRIELLPSATCELCQTCGSPEPVGTSYCERCGERPGLAHDDRSPNWRVEASSIPNHLKTVAQLPIALGVLRSAARENQLDALTAVLTRMREVLNSTTPRELITTVGHSDLWRVRRVLAELAGFSAENHAMLTLEALENQLVPVNVDSDERTLLFWVPAESARSPYENAPRELWDAVHASPEDDAPRRVLADVLIQAGDPLGEFIHRQLSDPTLEAPRELRDRFFRAPAHLVFDRGLPAALGAAADVALRHDLPRSIFRLELRDFREALRGRLDEQVRGLKLRMLRTEPDDPPGPLTRLGAWTLVELLGRRPGLEAFLAVDGKRSGLLFRAQWLSESPHSPREWFRTSLGTIPVIDRGVDPSGEWLVYALTAGEPIRRVPAGAWAPIARLLTRQTTSFPWTTLFAAPGGLQLQPLCLELDTRRRSRGALMLMPPEELRGRAPNGAVWGLAVQIAETLGQPIYPEGTDFDAVHFAVQGPPITLDAIPSPMREVLERCLIRDPERRARLDELISVLEHLPATIPPNSLSERERAAAQARPWLESPSVHDDEPRT